MGFRFNISKRISSGYFVMLFIVSITSVVSILQLEANKRKYNEISNIYLPTVSYLKELDALSKESNKLIVDWVRLANKDERERLKLIQSQEYPALKTRIQNFAATSSKPELQNKISSLLKEFDNSIVLQRKVMKKLETPEDYNSDSLVDAAINILETEISPRFTANQNFLSNVLSGETGALSKLQKELDIAYNYQAFMMILILIIIIVVGSIASYLATRSISDPIIGLKDVISSLGKGEIPNAKLEKRNDEIGEMTEAIRAMVESIKLKTEFATETGSGNYTAEFKLLSDKDVLGNALLTMRDNLRKTAEEDAGRNWINSGLAQSNELFRITTNSRETFYSNIIIFLAEYLDASLGGLYLVNEDDKDGVHLGLTASYAFDPLNIKGRKIIPGEGLAGQAALEKKMILLKDIPPGHMRIVSGLTEVYPKNIVLVPLVFENELKGLIELATTGEFSALHIEFLEKTSRNLAITFDLAARKTKTEALLSESHQLNERLKLSQEKLTTANAELSTFVYKASHDLRGPLSTMQGLINMVLTDPAVENTIANVESIGEMANKLDRILRVLIKMMSIRDSGINAEKINFKTKIQDVLLKLKDEKHMARIRIITNVETEREFRSDNEIIGYILQHILENAVKFQNFSNPESFAIIEVKDYQDGVKINISDNGVGIKSSFKSKVFEMFFRGHVTSTGSGLGLYFVKNAISKLEGRIELASEEGVGTMFSIFLPCLHNRGAASF